MLRFFSDSHSKIPDWQQEEETRKDVTGKHQGLSLSSSTFYAMWPQQVPELPSGCLLICKIRIVGPLPSERPCDACGQIAQCCCRHCSCCYVIIGRANSCQPSGEKGWKVRKEKKAKSWSVLLSTEALINTKVPSEPEGLKSANITDSSLQRLHLKRSPSENGF